MGHGIPRRDTMTRKRSPKVNREKTPRVLDRKKQVSPMPGEVMHRFSSARREWCVIAVCQKDKLRQVRPIRLYSRAREAKNERPQNTHTGRILDADSAPAWSFKVSRKAEENLGIVGDEPSTYANGVGDEPLTLFAYFFLFPKVKNELRGKSPFVRCHIVTCV